MQKGELPLFQKPLEPDLFLQKIKPNHYRLRLVVTPNAKQNAVVGARETAQGWAVRVVTTKAPENNKANESILEILANALKIGVSAIYLESGATQRHKSVAIIWEKSPKDLLKALL